MKVRWHTSGWHVVSVINVWTKYGELLEYGLIMKTWSNFNKLNRPEKWVNTKWHMLGWHVLSMINVYTNYGEPRLHGKEELI